MYFINEKLHRLDDTLLTAGQRAMPCYIDVQDNCIHTFDSRFHTAGCLLDTLHDDQLIILRLRGVTVMPVDIANAYTKFYGGTARAVILPSILRKILPEHLG